jgi:hypothetical protein
MAHVAMDTANPLGQRPFTAMGRLDAFVGPVPMPGDYDNNQNVLAALVSMGAITQQNATDIFDGHASLDDMAVNMTMISAALQQTGQAGLPIAVTDPAITNVVAKAPIDTSFGAKVGAALNAVTPSGPPNPSSGWAALGLTGTTGIIVGAAAIGLLLILTSRK